MVAANPLSADRYLACMETISLAYSTGDDVAPEDADDIDLVRAIAAGDRR